jgi:hypothetical protein
MLFGKDFSNVKRAQMPGAQASCLHERVSANNGFASIQRLK